MQQLGGAGFANLAYLPGLYLSGTFFPLPQAMRFRPCSGRTSHLNQLAFAAADVAKFRWIPVEWRWLPCSGSASCAAWWPTA